jgi:Protein of unknown function (DUF3891)
VILRDDGLGVPQTAHSALAGRLAEAWAIPDGLPAQDLRVAATIHDIGWVEWERDPRPVSFLDVETSEHVAIWTRGTDAAATFGRWVGLLVSLHCTRLMGWRQQGGRGGPEVDALVERERTRQAGLRAGLDDQVVEAASELIARWDGLSLALCGGKPADVDPWPFTAGTVPLTVDAVDLETGAWRSLDVSLSR